MTGKTPGRAWRWTKRLLLALVVLLVVGAAAGATYQALATQRDLRVHPAPGTMVDVGGYRLHLWCTGQTGPTVVFDAGLGGSSLDWGFVQPEVGTFARACSYDRAGMGWSDSGPSPRTSAQIVNDLHVLVRNARLPEPIILVGHSFGGYNIRLFAAKYHKEVSGMVLVDASHEDQWDRFPPEALPGTGFIMLMHAYPWLAKLGIMRLMGHGSGPDVGTLAPQVRDLAAVTFRTSSAAAASSEMLNIQTSAAQLKAVDRHLTIPLVVVTAGIQVGQPGDPPEVTRKIKAVWEELQRDQATLSPLGSQVTAAKSHHYVSLVQPELIVKAIRKVVEQVGRADSNGTVVQH